MKIKLLGVLLCIIAVQGCITEKQVVRDVESYGATWKFRAGEGLDSGWHRVAFSDVQWQDVLSTKTLARQDIPTMNGFGWYRKKIHFPKAQRKSFKTAEGIVLDLGKFAACEEVYVNETLIGKTGDFPPNYAGYSDARRQCFIPLTNLNLDGENLIAIKFHDGWSKNGGFLDTTVLQVRPASVLDKLDLQVGVADDDYIFLGNDSISVVPTIHNNGSKPVKGMLTVRLETDKRNTLKTEEIEVFVPAKGTAKPRVFGLSNPQPGFYRYEIVFSISPAQQMTKKFTVGYEPEKIISPNDQPADFDAFWKLNLVALSRVAPSYQLTYLPEQSKLDYDMYQVTMRSFDNETIGGYYAKPKKEGKHPVIVEYMGYGSLPYFPNQTWDGFAYFVLSVRGQALNAAHNRFGTWFTYGIDKKEDYYYRGAFLDVVRALDFVSSRAEIDSNCIAVRGSSQGGALSVVAASLDKRVKALAVGIPFLSDYRDYFSIASWPKSDVETYLSAHPEMTWENVYQTLSYFDIKNLASKIEVPMVMGIGVQDDVCPPHINFAMYNQVKSVKNWMAFPVHGHSTGDAFHQAGLALFRKTFNIKTY